MKKKNLVRGPEKLKAVMLRRVRKDGASLYLCLPKPWCDSRQITEGLTMALHLGKDCLKIMPVEEE